ncbi:MAG: sugar nucleotide-binding protein [Sumerlaeia bacterium]
MKYLITGARGTVGAALVRHLDALGHETVAWDRTRVPVNNYHAMEDYITEVRPDAIFLLAVASKPTGAIDNEGWVVNVHWPSEVAWICRQRQIPFVFSSTAMVFTNDAHGPFTPESRPDATEGYGGDKRQAEERLFHQAPEQCRVARLGWQIGSAPGGNNMLSFFEENMRQHGVIRASTRWLPACSFLEDTADGLMQVLAQPPGLYHINSNLEQNFYDIACALKAHHGADWKIEPTEDFVYDQRLFDGRIEVPILLERLPELAQRRVGPACG